LPSLAVDVIGSFVYCTRPFDYARITDLFKLATANAATQQSGVFENVAGTYVI